MKASTSGSQIFVAGTTPPEIDGKVLIRIYRYQGVLQVRRTQSLFSSGIQLQESFMNYRDDYLVQCVDCTKTSNKVDLRGSPFTSSRWKEPMSTWRK